MGDEQLEEILDEMLLEDDELEYRTISKWCQRYPEYSKQIMSFAATHAIQKHSRKTADIDEDAIAKKMVDHAIKILRS